MPMILWTFNSDYAKIEVLAFTEEQATQLAKECAKQNHLQNIELSDHTVADKPIAWVIFTD